MTEQPPQQPAGQPPQQPGQPPAQPPVAQPSVDPAQQSGAQAMPPPASGGTPVTQPAYAPAAPAAVPQQPAYAPAAPATQPGYGYPQSGAPVPPAGAGGTGAFFRSSRGKTIGLIVAGVVAVGAIGGIGAAVFGGDDELPGTSTGAVDPGEEITPDGGILSPSPIGTAAPQPSDQPSDEPTDGSEPTEEPAPTEEPSPVTPTEGPAPTLEPDSGGDVVTIGNGVQVPVLPGWQVVGTGASDVLLGDGQNSFVYAVTGTVDPSTDAASVIQASVGDILPKNTYTQFRQTDITPLQAFGSVVSMAGMQYQATWTDQQASVPLQGLLICAVRQDGTAVIITAEHAPPEEFEQSAESWAPEVNGILGLFGAA